MYNSTLRLGERAASTLPPAATIQSSEAATVGIGPAFRFRRFGDGSVAFREGFNWNFFGFVYLPLMRGRLDINTYTNELTVRGYAYSWPFLAAAVALYAHSQTVGGSISPNGPVVETAAFVMLFGILWTIQALRFRATGRCVAEMLNSARGSE